LKFDHLVITRFNVRINETPASDNWLRHRLHYFRTVCCPSLRSQANKNFRWVVLFDSVREPWFEAEVERLSDHGPFEAVWVNGKFTPTLTASIAAARSSAEWLITSRVDNDDAIARDYIDIVQSQFEEQEFEFINFQSGLQLTDSGELFHRLDPSNAFISLIERRTSEQPWCVYLAPHNEVKGHGKIRQIRSHPMWLQIIHDRNVENQARGVRANPRLLSEHFDIEMIARPIRRTELLASRAISATSLAWRVIQKPSRIAWLGKLVLNRFRMAVTSHG
jgi:hypothetical protein